ncbi:MAG: hypothetical protein AAF203_10575 [Pseudomonadota bacterium]
MQTKVRAGENAGETLRHEFTVLGKKDVILKKGASGTYTASLNLPQNDKAKPESYSVAFWVSEGVSQAPIQATGGFL